MNSRMNWVTFEVNFVSLSCIVQTLWQSQVIIEQQYLYLSFKQKMGAPKLEQKYFIKN